MITVVGQVVGHAGHVQGVDHLGNPEPYNLPADAFLRRQPAVIPIHFGHDTSWPIGVVELFQRSRSDGLVAVGRIGDDGLADLLADGPWYWSDGVTCRPTGPLEMGGAKIRELSLVRRTANLNTPPVVWATTDVGTDAGGRPHGMRLGWHDAWEAAHEAIGRRRYRRAPDHLEIIDRDPLGVVDEMLTDPVAARRRAAASMPPASAPVGPRVRLDGVWLDEAGSARVLDALDAQAFG